MRIDSRNNLNTHYSCFYPTASDVLTSNDEIGSFAIRLSSIENQLTLLVVTIPHGRTGRQVMKHPIKRTSAGLLFGEHTFALLSQLVEFATRQKVLDMLVPNKHHHYLQ